MRGQLHIGEVAELLGVTQKTIRHYHKVGLLAEPERSNGGYRLYSAGDLLRLLHIRRLQALGLTLAQIKQVLGEPDREHTLREVLTALAKEIESQIATLTARKERIQTLLAGDNVDVMEHTSMVPDILRETMERLDADQMRQISDDVMAHDVRIFGLLESFAWPEQYQMAQEQMAREIQHLISQPDIYGEMVALANDLAALAQMPAESEEVERLVERFATSPIAPLMQAFTTTAPSPQVDVLGGLLGEIMQSTLTSAQARFIQLLGRRLDRDRREGGT